VTALLAAATATLTAARDGLEVLAIDVTPGEPPGFGGVSTILGWVAWFVTGACVLGVLIVAIKLAIAHRRGEGGEAAGQLGWVAFAGLLGAAAGPLVTGIPGLG
jgi:hypothetical protein